MKTEQSERSLRDKIDRFNFIVIAFIVIAVDQIDYMVAVIAIDGMNI